MNIEVRIPGVTIWKIKDDGICDVFEGPRGDTIQMSELDLERQSHILQLGFCQHLAPDHRRCIAQMGQCTIINEAFA
jgi:hypothetical protein